MTKDYNRGPQSPTDFLKELQRTADENESESAAQPNSIEPAPSTVESEPYQDQIEAIQTAAIAAIARFTNQVQMELFHMDFERRELQFQCKTLTEQNKQMSLKVEELNDTLASRDATINELAARIEKLSSEKAKLQTA